MSPAIKLLGTVVLQRGDGVVAQAGAVPTSKALDLLRLLVAAGGQEQGSDHYIGLLWPTADDARGRMSLRTAIAQLRRAVGPEVVHRSGDLIRLGDIDSDVDQLRRGVAAVEREQRHGQDGGVLRLVRDLEVACGADLVVSGGSCAAVYALREELRDLRAQVLLAGSAAAARLAYTRESLELAHRADQLAGSESSARALMIAWSALGETRRAVETFDRLRDHLAAAYGVQPAPETRALYLQVVTAGDGLSLRPAEHHRDVIADLAATVLDMVEREDEDEEPGGVIWLHGQPGSGRGAIARESVRLLGRVRSDAVDHVLILPEVIVLEDFERQRLRREALADRSALIVPVRRSVRRDGPNEAALEVPVLERTAFVELLTQLLQERPSPALADRLWSTTGGLAGHVCRTVGELVRQGQLRWEPGEVSLRPRTPRRGRPSSVRHHAS